MSGVSGPPKHVVEYWESEPNWIRRFMRGSEINAFLCDVDVYNQAYTLWTPSARRKFVQYMEEVAQTLPKKTVLYRGTSTFSPTYQPLCETMVNCQFLSTSKSKSIAREFIRRKGYLHVLEVHRGVQVYDLQSIYNENDPSREKEVLIYPGARLELLDISGKTLRWKVVSST